MKKWKRCVWKNFFNKNNHISLYRSISKTNMIPRIFNWKCHFKIEPSPMIKNVKWSFSKKYTQFFKLFNLYIRQLILPHITMLKLFSIVMCFSEVSWQERIFSRCGEQSRDAQDTTFWRFCSEYQFIYRAPYSVCCLKSISPEQQFLFGIFELFPSIIWETFLQRVYQFHKT